MKLAAVAKWLTLIGGAIQAAALNNTFGAKWSPVIGSIGTAMVATGAAIASQTSAGHPNGEQTTKSQSAPLISG